jgi:hypothetical protein
MTSLRPMRPLIRAWTIGSSFSAVVVAALLLVSPFVMPPSDPLGLYRYFVNRVAAAVWGIVAVTGGVLFFDYVTPGNWLEKIEEGNTACAIVTVGVIAALGLVLCYV